MYSAQCTAGPVLSWTVFFSPRYKAGLSEKRLDMVILFDPVGSLENLEQMIAGAASSPGVSGLMILACDANGFTPDAIDPILGRAPVAVFGGVFPSIIYGKELLERGSLVIGLPGVLETRFIHGLSDSEIDYEACLELKSHCPPSALTMMVFVDGFARRVGAFVDALFNVFGLQMNYIGGGAGSSSMESKPCLFTNRGMLADGVVLALLELGSGVGVSHGWKPLSGPYQVTSSHLNTIQTLEWKPALDVYRQIVEQDSEMTLDDSNFFTISRSYPFGISRLESEYVARDILRPGPDRSLVCIGEVPQGAFVYILKGDKASLGGVAGNALDLAVKAFPVDREVGLQFFMVCFSKSQFLGEGFRGELEALRRKDMPLIGACTVGEIANCGTEFLEYYTKTAVVAVLEAE